MADIYLKFSQDIHLKFNKIRLVVPNKVLIFIFGARDLTFCKQNSCPKDDFNQSVSRQGMATAGPRHILQIMVTSCCRYGSVRMCPHASTSTLSAVCKTTPQALQFSDHHRAFQHKSTRELLRALLVLRACGSNFLVDNSLKVNLKT